MAYILSKVGQSFNVPVHIYEADTEEDMKDINIQEAPMGSKCHIINDGKWYMLNSKSEWKIMPSGGSGAADSAGSVIDKSVTSITSNVAEVGQYAFYGCEMLETASFPEATKIQGGSFVGCKALVSVSAPNVTEIMSDVINYLFIDMDGNYAKDSIGAFSKCTNLTTTNFPAAVTIGDSAFSGCTNLTTADFQLAETIGDSAFSGCTNLTTADFQLAETIGDSAFFGCTSLSTADFPAAVTIGFSAFSSCAGLTELKFPRVKTIGALDNAGGMLE